MEGLGCLAAMKVKMLHPPVALISNIHVESQLSQWEGSGRQGLLSHQGASLVQGRLHFPWLPVPWGRFP